MNDVFSKCGEMDDLREVQRLNAYPYFHSLASATGPEVEVEGRRMLMFASNDYLGLAAHPAVKEAAQRAIEQYGTGCGASRFLGGTTVLHDAIEAAFARFFHKQAALVFSTGMQTNLGVISSLARSGDVVVTDRLDHASILDGCRLSSATMRRFAHNDARSLDRVLGQSRAASGVLVVIEGVYSMEGDVAPLPELLAVARHHGARVLLDDAHGAGVLGASGAGTAEHFNCLDHVDLIMTTFSKAFASIGGVVAGNADVIQYIKHRARSLIFSAAIPPPNVAAVSAALEIVQHEPDRRARVLAHGDLLRGALQKLGFNTGPSCTPIVPLIVGARDRLCMLWRMLYDAGFFTSSVTTPAVPRGHDMLRLTVSANHTPEHIRKLVEACAVAGRQLSIVHA